jgi:hypothetical protein
MMTFKERLRQDDLEECAIEQGEATVSYAYPLHNMCLGGIDQGLHMIPFPTSFADAPSLA